MLPVLLDIKFLKIYTFGIFLVLAFFWSCYFLWKNISLTSYKEEDVFDVLFTALVGGLFFGRLIYVILNFDKFGFDLLKFILINGYPGISFFGLVIGILVCLLLGFPSKKIKFTEIIDYFIAPFFLALAIGKLGSFLAGVDIGTKTNFFLKIRYVGFDGLRNLTALYESIFFLLGFALANKLLMDLRKGKIGKGFLFYFFCWSFSLIGFVFDGLKEKHLYLAGQNFNWYAYAILLLTFSLYFIYYFRTLFLAKLKSIINFFNLWQHKLPKHYPKNLKKDSRKS